MYNNLNIKTAHVCRTCLKKIINTSFFHLDFTQVDSELTIGQMLSYCISELDLNIVANTVICGKCVDSINSIYIFKKECLRFEMQIREYIQQVQHTGKIIDLAEVIQFHQLHSKDLTTELTAETFEKTENYQYEELYSKNLIAKFKTEALEKNEESSTCFYDNYHFKETEGNTEIKTQVFEKTENYKNEESTTCSDNYPFNEIQGNAEIANNEYLTSLEMVDRECVVFNTVEDLFNSGKSEAEQNSGTHNDSNIGNDCLLQIVESVQNVKKTDIYFHCTTCGHKAESKLKLIRHLKSHRDKTLYQKKISFNSRKSLLCWYRCDLCNYSTKHKCLFNFHSRAHLMKNNYQHILKSRPNLVKHSSNTIIFDKKVNKINCGSRSSNRHNFKFWCKSLSKYSASKQHSNQYNISKLAIDTNIIVNNTQTHTSEKPFKCSICEYSCNHKHSFKIHMLTHTGEKPFKCSVCEYSCIRKNYLNRHMLTHTGEKPFKCSICEHSFNKKSHLKMHLLIHTSEKPFKCSLCEYSCNRKDGLKNHMLTHTGEKPFKCSVCEYSCIRKNDLNSHILIHTGEKPFKCSICEYSCNRKDSLKNHMLTHTGEKPFKCTFCEYSCKYEHSLNSHMLTHIDEKPFKCLFCEYSCIRNDGLKIHMLTHEKPFKCSFCEYSCKHERSLNIHMLTHIDDKPFKCSFCEYSFKYRGCLNVHMLTHIAEENYF